jgi:hypothetical protein
MAELRESAGPELYRRSGLQMRKGRKIFLSEVYFGSLGSTATFGPGLRDKSDSPYRYNKLTGVPEIDPTSAQLFEDEDDDEYKNEAQKRAMHFRASRARVVPGATTTPPAWPIRKY